MLVKKCFECGYEFKFNPFSISPYCNKEKCQDKYKEALTKIIHTRAVPISWFDLYDTTFLYKNTEGIFERACRVCGGRLRTVKGKYSSVQRNCKEHTKVGWVNSDFCWNIVRDSYISKLQENNIDKIKSWMKEQDKNEKYYKYYIFCEECGIFKNTNNVNIHHIKPVHTLEPTEEGIMDIFDDDNLICLCLKCHHKQDHQLGLTIEEKKEKERRKKIEKEKFYRKFKKLDLFLK